MLKQLTIKNFVLIEQITIELDNALNVLTGETGAGKSLIIEAIGLLIGQRASSDFIREGYEKAYIEGFFEVVNIEVRNYLEDLGIDVLEGLVLGRELSKNGKNSCRINGRLVPLSLYGEVGSKLVDIHGQNQELTLLSTAKQMNLLDNFGGEQILAHKKIISKLYQEIKDISRIINEYQVFNDNKIAKLEFLEYQIDEIKSACLQVNEEEELLREKNILMNFEKLSIGSNMAYNYLFGGDCESRSAYDLLSLAAEELDKITVLDSSLEPSKEGIYSLLYQLEEFARDIKAYADSKEQNPTRLDEIEHRLDIIRNLKRKYGCSIEEILNKLVDFQKEFDEIEQSSQNLKFHEDKVIELEIKIKEECNILRKLRLEVAKELESLINDALKELDLSDAHIKIQVEPLNSYEPSGMDRVEFLFSSNKGESLKPLNKIASGGEISRVMLAFKSILSKYDNIMTMVFDEIDTGVGGNAIINIGRKISALASNRQVICVTHSPGLASFADTHFLIFKEFKDKRTVTKISKLTVEERVTELSRMLGGVEQIDTASDHAREMLKFASNEKCV